MTISLSDAGKRFNRDWIFRHFTYTFEEGGSYAITGSNGSGKSTLLQVLSGSMHFNEGVMNYHTADGAIQHEDVFQHIAICAPYLEVVEEMTFIELLDFHQQFKPFLPGITSTAIVAELGLEKAAQKQIRYYSSGMKQRVKLAQCIFSDTAVVLLDEPCTNLDSTGIALYQELIKKYCSKRLVIVSSNDEVEYSFCKQRINLSDYK
jgi:ABC-type multidrug transport system ATPase subunit